MTATEYRSDLKTGRSLIHNDLWERMVFNHTRVYKVERPWAERVLDQAIAFLDMVGTTGQKLSPSPVVDEGWHTFILHTGDYDPFCQVHYGRFVGHIPFGPTEIPDPTMLPRTMGQLAEHGYHIDRELWTGQPDCRNSFQPSWVAPCNHTCDSPHGEQLLAVCNCHDLDQVMAALQTRTNARSHLHGTPTEGQGQEA